jgi:DNA gyrase/topoisomerase IV subunit B
MSELHSGSKFEGSNTLARIGEHGCGMSSSCFTSSIFIIMSKITEFNYDRSIQPVKELWESAGPRSKKDLFYIIVFEEGLNVFEGAGKLKELEKKIFKGIKNYVSIPEGQSTITIFKPDPKIWENCTPEIPMTNLQYFLLIQEKFFKKKVNVVVDGVNLRSTFNPYKFEIIKTIIPKDTSVNKQVGLYITFEADPSLGNAQVFGSINGLDCNLGTHINLGRNLYKEALKAYFGVKHDYLLNGLKMVIIVLANEVQYNSQTKENLKQITKVKPDDFAEVLKDFQRIFKKNEDYWGPHVDKLNQLAESLKSITAMDKAQKMIDSSGSNVSSYRAKADYPKTFADATSKDRSQCELLLVEGNSAQTSLVMGRKDTRFHACLGLRGKILNVTDKGVDRALESKVISDIFNIIGLGLDINWVGKDAKTYEEAHEIIMKRSRYARIIIATD